MIIPSKIMRPPEPPASFDGLTPEIAIQTISQYFNNLHKYMGDAFLNEYKSESQWHNFGDSGEPAFQNGWGDYGNGYSPPGFIRIASNVVMLRGLVAGGTPGAGTGVVATLPEQFRPSNHHLTATCCNGSPNFGTIYVSSSTGEVRVNTGSGTWTSLDNIIFRID